jgi:hypothetical protein
MKCEGSSVQIQEVSSRRKDLVVRTMAAVKDRLTKEIVAVQAAMEDDFCQPEARLITLAVAAPDKLGCQIIRRVEVTHCVQPPKA